MGKRPRVDWVSTRYGTSESRTESRTVCERCGAEHVLVLPMSANAFVKVLRGFIAAHSECREKSK